MNSSLTALRHLLASLRMLLVFTAILGVGYPLVITAVAQLPGLRPRADGSVVSAAGRSVGSALIGQNFTDAAGTPLPQYFQSRPSAAGAGYDATASSASNLGPESIVDTLPDPAVSGDTGTASLLTQVCRRSLRIGREFGVSGARPYCTADGVGAVLAVFYAGPGYHGAVTRVVSLNQACPARPFVTRYAGVAVQCARYGTDYAAGQVVPVRGDAPARPAVPADAVTASGSGLDPDISPAYAQLQTANVARARHLPVSLVAALVRHYTHGRFLGFIGEPTVDVLDLNLALDQSYPVGR